MTIKSKTNNTVSQNFLKNKSCTILLYFSKIQLFRKGVEKIPRVEFLGLEKLRYFNYFTTVFMLDGFCIIKFCRASQNEVLFGNFLATLCSICGKSKFAAKITFT